MFAMEFFQPWRHRATGTALRIGEDQQRALSPQLRQRQFAAVEPWQAEIRCWRARLQSVAFDPAARCRAAVKPSRSSRGNEALIYFGFRISQFGIPSQRLLTSAARLIEFELVQSFLKFVETQEDATVLSEQLPAEPADQSQEAP